MRGGVSLSKGAPLERTAEELRRPQLRDAEEGGAAKGGDECASHLSGGQREARTPRPQHPASGFLQKKSENRSCASGFATRTSRTNLRALGNPSPRAAEAEGAAVSPSQSNSGLLHSAKRLKLRVLHKTSRLHRKAPTDEERSCAFPESVDDLPGGIGLCDFSRPRGARR